MKVVFHGKKFIQYAPLYMLSDNIGDGNEIEFREPDENILNGNYEISEKEIQILLLGQDRLLPLDSFVNITQLIWQKPLKVIKSTSCSNGKWLNYRPGNSFRYVMSKFSDEKSLELVDIGVDVFHNEEFLALNNGEAEFAFTWNPWEVKEYENVKLLNKPMPITPFAWTCLILKRAEANDNNKLKFLSQLVEKLYENIYSIYSSYEHAYYNTGKSKKNKIIESVKCFVDESEHQYISNALKNLAKEKIWYINEIYRDSKAFDLSNYLFQELNDSLTKIKSIATRAAISQDQTRNGSHNIGSHVLSKLIGDLSEYRFKECYSSVLENGETKKTFATQKLAEELNDIDNEISKYNTIISNYNVENHSSQLKELKEDNDEYNELVKWGNLQYLENTRNKNLLAAQSKLNNYIKCRMEYLSDVSYGIPAMQVTKHLKTEVLDELDNVRLLLENISGLSDFKYSIDIKCDFDDDDPAVAMPNDILGCQAFYNIIENVIRNTAKHANLSNIDDNMGIVRFTIEIKKIENINALPEKVKKQAENLYEVVIYDNVIIDSEREQASYSDTMSLDYRQNMKLNESILNKDDHTLRSTGLGLIEMEAAACYLRKMDISNLNRKTDTANDELEYFVDHFKSIYNHKYENINILKAVKVQNDDNYYLGYRLFLLKPTEVIFVGGYQPNDELTKIGVHYLKEDEFKQNILDGKVFNHQFLVYETNEVLNFIITKNVLDRGIEVYQYRTLLPKRILQIAPSDLKDKSQNIIELRKFLWEKWAKKNEKWSSLEIRNSVQTENDNNNYCFLNHAAHQLNENEKERFEQYFDDPNNRYYIEALSSLGQQKLPMFATYSVNKENGISLNNYINHVMDDIVLKNLIKESAWQKIVVIDERIQQVAYHQKFEGCYFKVYYQHSNIIVPPEEINLATSTIIDIESVLNEFIEKEVDEESYLVVHYSLLERLYKDDCLRNKWLNKFSAKTNVIVTSGRSVSADLPPSICFVNLSPIWAALVDFRSKYYLHQVLLSSRKSNEL